MSRTEIEQQVNEFLVDKLELEATQIRPDAELKMDLGLTSIDVVESALFVKQKYGFMPQIEEIKAIITLEDLYDYIEKNQPK